MLSVALSLLLSVAAPPDTGLPFQPRPVIDTLCSPAFFGRGYQKKGAERVASYLARRLEAAGVSSGAVSGDYLQTFTFNLNHIEGEPSFSVGLTKGQLGKDFLPDATTPSARLKLAAEPYDSTAWLAMGPLVQANTALVFSSQAQFASFLSRTEGKPGMAVVRHAKLPAHTLSGDVAAFPIVHITDALAPRPGDKVSYRINTSMKPTAAANVLGMVVGTAHRDSFLIVGAHYDHLGGMGATLYYPGANDNATGTAMLLELATAIARKPLRYTVVFAFFGAEEVGLKGSTYFTDNPVLPLENVRFMLNLDLIGSGEDGATFVNAPAVQPDFDLLKQINTQLGQALPALRPRRNAPNSDHYPFTQAEVPAGFLYLQGPFAYYHSPEDKPRPELTLAGFAGTFRLCKRYLQNLAGDK
jgi:hypothetical protein